MLIPGWKCHPRQVLPHHPPQENLLWSPEKIIRAVQNIALMQSSGSTFAVSRMSVQQLQSLESTPLQTPPNHPQQL